MIFGFTSALAALVVAGGSTQSALFQLNGFLVSFAAAGAVFFHKAQ